MAEVEAEKKDITLAYIAARKILSDEIPSREEIDALCKVHSRVAMTMASERCKGVVGKTTVERRRWDFEKKDWGEPVKVEISSFNVCVGHSLVELDNMLRNRCAGLKAEMKIE